MPSTFQRVCFFSCMASIAGCGLAQSITPIGVPSGAWSTEVAGVSADGSRVALKASGPGSVSVWTWSSAGGLERIGPAIVGAWGAPRAISGDGSTIAGGWSNMLAPGFRWTAQSGYQELARDDEYSELEVLALNYDGQYMAGAKQGSMTDPYSRAARWTPAGDMELLGTLPGMTYSEANGISADGSIIIGRCGVSPSAGPARAFRWTEQGGMQDIGTPAGFASAFARAISADGTTIVGGSYGSPTSYEQMCVWSNGVVRNLDAPAGYNMATALGVSADGTTIVGAATFLDEMGVYDAFHATIWTEALGHRDLEEYLGQLGMDMTGWDLHYARGASADGTVIVGDGYYNGVYQGWVVTIPSPGAAGLLGVGLLVAAYPRRRRMSGYGSPERGRVNV